MANNVNPPPLLRIPRAFLQDREVRAFVEQQNTIIFQLWNKTGGNNDPISEIGNEGNSNFSSFTQQLNRRLDGLSNLTIDTNGFTVDTTLITTDKVIA